ncbi:phosphopantothenoylcysteine decarboxylase [uncultured Microbacterium sp.]|uniref:phosphopantothenoylcysteine decarboxylase domain-containing protein n=1 Tax=uncultured Microbacterium sp. TaxID=191216 RepID=UPI0032B1D97F
MHRLRGDLLYGRTRADARAAAAVCAAAVSDFKPLKKNKNKLNKDSLEINSIKLQKNTDIVEYLGKNNKYRPKLVVSFAAETENLNKNAISKLKKKNCDFIIANDVSKKDSGFNSDYNRVSIIDGSGKIKIIKKNKKSFIANKIAEIILEKLLVDEKSIN